MKSERRCDLHVHTTFSDGLLSPEQIVLDAARLGLAAVAISDHDAVGGIEPALRVARSLRLEVVPAIEMSCMLRRHDIHILGYEIDHRAPELLSFLDRVRDKRLERARKMIANLRRQGVELEMNRVIEIAQGGALGRPHIARALLERGHIRNLDEAFERFIGYHSPAYAPKMEIRPDEAIRFIRRHGGVPVAAHPASYDSDEVMNDLIAAGLMGIEVYHPDHDPAAVEHYLEVAQKNNLLVTGGSDCHGGRRSKFTIGQVTVPFSNLAALRRRKAEA